MCNSAIHAILPHPRVQIFAIIFLLQNLYISDFFCTFAAKLELKEEYERIRF